MGHAVKLAFVFPIVFAHAVLHAQTIYMCKDASGRTLTSDRPMPECEGQAVREFNKSGMLRRDIPPPPTLEQKRQLQLEEEKRRAADAVADEQKRQDLIIRTTYYSEADIARARQEAIALEEEQIRRDRVALVNALREQKLAHADAAPYTQKKKPLPAGIKQRVTDLDEIVEAINESILEHETEIGQINIKFDALLKRFRELMAKR